MTVTPKQEKLYNAVTAIDDTFLEEVLSSPRHFVSATVKRLAAIAAVAAIIIGFIAFWPATNNEPIFSVTVNAADDLDSTVTITANQLPEYEPNTGHIKDSLDSSWMNLDLFCIQVEMDGVSDDYMTDSHVVIDYNGQSYSDAVQTDHLSLHYPDDKSNGNLCLIYGWAEDVSIAKLEFSLQIYHEETLLYAQDFVVFYSNDTLVINGQRGSSTDSVSWSINLKTTEELVEMIANDNDPFNSTVYSDPSLARADMLDHYAPVLAVLDTRDDAGSAILQKLIAFDQMSEEDFNKDWIKNILRIGTLQTLLSDRYHSQLTDDEHAEYDKLNLDRFLGS